MAFVAPSYLRPAPAIRGSYTTVWVPAGGPAPPSPFLGMPTAAAAQRGNIAYNQIRGTSRQGDGSRLQMFGGAIGPVAGHVAAYDANGNVIDGGAYAAVKVNGTPTGV